jgi:hypothetical protein
MWPLPVEGLVGHFYAVRLCLGDHEALQEGFHVLRVVEGHLNDVFPVDGADRYSVFYGESRCTG